MFRIGHGYDAHSFEEGRPLVLGGVTIPFIKGMKAHSDGDVVLHSVCDALLGASAMGDIGQHFPDTDQKYCNIDSRILLRHISERVQEKGYLINNLDITVLAQVPKLAPYIYDMRQAIAEDLRLVIDQVNIKATTTEKMGFVGREEGIAAYSIVLLEKI